MKKRKRMLAEEVGFGEVTKIVIDTKGHSLLKLPFVEEILNQYDEFHKCHHHRCY